MGNRFGWTVQQVEDYYYIGRGSFGLVYCVNYPFYFGKYAVKLVRLPDENIENLLMREVETLKKVNYHENVIKVYAAELVPERTLMIWMEYCNIGDLDHYMRNKKPSIDEIISMMTQLCDAVMYIHSQGVIHRNIKPGNILLSSKFLSYPRVKLSDLGLGNFVESISLFSGISFNTTVGTQSYAAPEINKPPYDNSVDIYSMGGVLEDLVYYNSKLFKYNNTIKCVYR